MSLNVHSGLWQRERDVWFWVSGGIVYAAQIVPSGLKYEAFDLISPVPQGQGAPVRIGEFDTLDEAKKAAEQYFEEM